MALESVRAGNSNVSLAAFQGGESGVYWADGLTPGPDLYDSE